MEHKQFYLFFKHAFNCSFKYIYKAFLKHILITNKAYLEHFCSTIKSIFEAYVDHK
jgi:hypothetical protein